jgi:hypothetical protein
MGAYPPTDGYAKSFYCSTFCINMKSLQMHLKILNWITNMWELTICLNIQNMWKDCQDICPILIFTTVCRVSSLNFQVGTWNSSISKWSGSSKKQWEVDPLVKILTFLANSFAAWNNISWISLNEPHCRWTFNMSVAALIDHFWGFQRILQWCPSAECIFGLIHYKIELQDHKWYILIL